MIIEESIKIDAPIEKVWQTFTDLTRWAEWNTVIGDVVCTDKCLVGGKGLRCCFRPFLFPVKADIKIHEVVPLNRVVWSVQKPGLFAYHEFFFEKEGAGVIVTSKETFSGIFSSGDGILLPEKRMRELTRTFLNDLKKAAERFRTSRNENFKKKE